MPVTLDLNNVVEDIISSYEKKLEKMSSIFDTTYLILSDFQESILATKEEREKTNTHLRDILAKNEHLRKKDFDNMMQGILLTQDQREKEIRGLLKNYLNDQKNMPQTLREGLKKFKDSLAEGESSRAREFQGLIKEILAGQEERKNEVTSKLKEFQKGQQEMAKGLKELLAKGRELRIKDLKSMLKEFKIQREKRLAFKRKRKEEVTKMLDRFRKERQEVHSSPTAVKIDVQVKNR